MPKAFVIDRTLPNAPKDASDLSLFLSLAPVLTILLLLAAFFIAMIESPRPPQAGGSDLMLMSGP